MLSLVRVHAFITELPSTSGRIHRSASKTPLLSQKAAEEPPISTRCMYCGKIGREILNMAKEITLTPNFPIILPLIIPDVQRRTTKAHSLSDVEKRVLRFTRNCSNFPKEFIVICHVHYLEDLGRARLLTSLPRFHQALCMALPRHLIKFWLI